jgi:putative ABC transport system ATP-binding protein
LSASRRALELDDVVKEYPGHPPVRALDGVTLIVHEGESVAIVGPSGSGKSTLLQIVSSLDRPTSGVVRIAGYDVSAMSDNEVSATRAALIGFVFQEFYLLDGISALDNVAQGLLYMGMRRRERHERAAAALERVGLGRRAGHTPAMLSGGERQRVAIARALVREPAVVMADEPTGNLDSVASASLMRLLRELNGEGSTLMVITHDREIAGSLSRQVHLRDGRVENDTGTPVTMETSAL